MERTAIRAEERTGLAVAVCNIRILVEAEYTDVILFTLNQWIPIGVCAQRNNSLSKVGVIEMMGWVFPIVMIRPRNHALIIGTLDGEFITRSHRNIYR